MGELINSWDESPAGKCRSLVDRQPAYQLMANNKLSGNLSQKLVA